MISILSKFVARRRLRGGCLGINSVLSIVLMLVIIVASSKAQANRHQTNRNDISNLFNQEIEDRQGLDQFLENSKKQAESGVGSKAGLRELGANESALENKTSELNSINANSLESRGQIERAKEENSYYDSLEIDYTDPKILNHKRDIDKIADANKRLMSRLIEGLRDLDIDCKTVKGDKELEPQYVIEIEKEHFKDVTYNQHICEELRNRYNCNDTVTLKCAKTGLRYGEWQHKTIKLPGHALHNEKMHWGYAVKWKYKRWGWHITPYHPKGKGEYQIDSPWKNNPELIIADARLYLANKLGVQLEQIREDVGFPPGGRGVEDGSSINPVGCRWRVAWNEYEFTYYYRDTYPVCEVWSEDWNEVCRLQ